MTMPIGYGPGNELTTADDGTGLDIDPAKLNAPVPVNKGGTGSATGNASGLNNIPGAQVTGNVPRAAISTALAAGGDPVQGTAVTATTDVRTDAVNSRTAASIAYQSSVADASFAIGHRLATTNVLGAFFTSIATFENPFGTVKASVLADGTFFNTTSVITPKVGPVSTSAHTIPAGSPGNIVVDSATQTLTNKTIGNTNNTVSGTVIQEPTIRLTVDQSTASGSFVDVPGMSITFSKSANTRVRIAATYSMANQGLVVPADCFIRLVVDGAAVNGGSSKTITTSDELFSGSISRLFTTGELTSSSHTAKLQFRSDAGNTLSCSPANNPDGEHMTLIVQEVRT